MFEYDCGWALKEDVKEDLHESIGNEIVGLANVMGKEGWELVSTLVPDEDGDVCCIFKRKKEG